MYDIILLGGDTMNFQKETSKEAKNITLYLNKKSIDKLKLLSEYHKISMNRIIERLIDDEINKM